MYLQRNFGRTGGWSERGLSSPIDRHHIAADLLDPLFTCFKAGSAWITQVIIVAGVGSPFELSEEEMFTAFVHCGALELDPEREDRHLWS